MLTPVFNFLGQTGYYSVIGRWAEDPRGVIATLASSDLLFNTLARLDASVGTALIELAAGSTVVSLLLTTLTQYNSTFTTLATIFQYALIAFFIYEFAPRIYPDGFGPVTDQVPFRLLTVVATFAFILDINESIALPVPPLGLATLLFSGYLLHQQDQSLYEQLDTESGPFYAVLSTLVPDSEAEDDVSVQDSVGASGIRGRLAAWAIIVLVGAVFAIICALFGMLSIAIEMFYPVLELSALGYVVYGRVEQRVPQAPSPETAVPELEDTFYESIAPAFRRVPIKGMATVLLIGFGLTATGSGFEFVGTAIASGAVLAMLTGSDLNVATMLLFGGALVYSVAAMVFWFQITRRTPALFDYYRSLRDHDELTAPREPPVTRPPGAMVPPTLLVVIPVMLAGLSFGSVVTGVLVLCWALALGATGWAMWQIRVRAPQPPSTDRIAIPIAFAVQLVIPLYMNAVKPTLTNPVEGATAFLTSSGYVAIMTAAMGVVFFFLEDAMWYMRQGRPGLKYLPAAMGVMGGLLAVPLLDGVEALVLIGVTVLTSVILAGLAY